jgi:outer membrane scaffolding protein for murein synthesis (MipA/OmpV family)
MIRYLLLLSLFLTPLFSQEYSLKLGVATGVLYYPNYIGSKSSNTLVTPFPYLRYKGEIFQIDEDGLSGKLFGVNGLKIDLSVSAALPAQSEEDSVRKDMPDLDLTGEVGFKLIYEIFSDSPHHLAFEFPLRSVLSTDFTNLKYRGIVSNPQLKYSLKYTQFKWTFRAGAFFSDKNYNNYYYGVSQEYQTPTRSFYKADAGFAGLRARVGLTYEKGNWWAKAFVSYFNISDAVFYDSPLVETPHAVYSGVSLAYIFYTSD